MKQYVLRRARILTYIYYSPRNHIGRFLHCIRVWSCHKRWVARKL